MAWPDVKRIIPLRLALIVGTSSVAVILFTVWFMYFREPSYSGKGLNEWLQSLNPVNPTQYEVSADAIRHIGEESVPHLLRYLQPQQDSFLHDKLTAMIERFTPFHFPVRQRLSAESVEAFKVLGSRGFHAIPELHSLAHNRDTCSDASLCLAYIGPAAMPTLTNLLCDADHETRYAAIDAIGEMGTNGLPAIPLLLRQLDSSNSNRGMIIRVIGELNPPNPEIRSQLIGFLSDTNQAFDAAFALGRMGELQILQQSLTNSHREIRIAATAALDPQFRELGPGRKRPSLDYRFMQISCIYNFKVMHAAFKEKFPETPTSAGPTGMPNEKVLRR